MTRQLLRRHIVAGTITLGIMLPMLALAASVKVPGLPKPLGQISLAQLTGRVIRAAMGISGAVALIMFIWGGVQWMSSQGNAEKTKKAQNTLLWSVIGLIAIFGAYTLLNFVLGVL